MKLTLITNNDGLLTKRISLDGDGNITKQTHATITSGTAKRVQSNSFHELRKTFEGLRTDQAVIHCPHNHELDNVRLTLKNKVQNGAIARTAEFFQWSKEAVTVSFDFDLTEDGWTRDKWIESMVLVSPVFVDAGCVMLSSSSGGIRNAAGELLADSKGMRFIFAVEDASDLDRFGEVLFRRCWLAGFGRIQISATGSMLKRTIFDQSMFQPQRIDFLAGAELDSGLTQTRDVDHREGKLINTRLVLDLTTDEEIEFENLVHQAEQANKETADRVREQWREARIASLVDEGKSRKEARKMIDAKLSMTIFGTDRIVFDDFGEVSVLDCLIEPEKFDGKQCADPNEPEQGRTRAVFRWNDDKTAATVWSFLHGGQLYRLKFDFASLMSRVKTLEPDALLDDFETLAAQAELSPIELDRFLLEVKTRTGVTKDTLQKAMKSDFDALTHQQMAEIYTKQKGQLRWTDGEFWLAHDDAVWRVLNMGKVRVEIGVQFENQKRAKTESAYKQVSNQIANYNDDPEFFKDAPKGFACPSGFFFFDDDGQLVNEKLKLAHRARFVMPFDPVDEAPSMLLDFAAQCFDGEDPDGQITRLQELFGVTLLGIGVQFEKAFFCLGPANTGKSTMMRILVRMIPDEFVCAVPPSHFGNDYFKAMLAGKLLCTMGEGEGLILGDDFKSMTGRDPQIARPIYKEPFTFYPSAMMVINANEPPKMSETSDAILRRLETLSFPNSRVKMAEKNIPDLDQRIIAEDAGRILFWAMQGARRVMDQNGYSPSIAHKQQLERWKLSNCKVEQFLHEAGDFLIVTGKHEDVIKKSSLYSQFRYWCEHEGIEPYSKAKFKVKLTKLGHSPVLLDGNYIYRGMKSTTKDGLPW